MAQLNLGEWKQCNTPLFFRYFIAKVGWNFSLIWASCLLVDIAAQEEMASVNGFRLSLLLSIIYIAFVWMYERRSYDCLQVFHLWWWAWGWCWYILPLLVNQCRQGLKGDLLLLCAVTNSFLLVVSTLLAHYYCCSPCSIEIYLFACLKQTSIYCLITAQVLLSLSLCLGYT